jgi:hypothetical protein
VLFDGRLACKGAPGHCTQLKLGVVAHYRRAAADSVHCTRDWEA